MEIGGAPQVLTWVNSLELVPLMLIGFTTSSVPPVLVKVKALLDGVPNGHVPSASVEPEAAPSGCRCF